jgi:hypothetical protein
VFFWRRRGRLPVKSDGLFRESFGESFRTLERSFGEGMSMEKKGKIGKEREEKTGAESPKTRPKRSPETKIGPRFRHRRRVSAGRDRRFSGRSSFDADGSGRRLLTPKPKGRE